MIIMDYELISWNVNGIRACISKGMISWIKQRNPDVVCIQETKAQPEQLSLALDLPDYHTFWNSAEKKGYSGVLTLTKEKPLGTQAKLKTSDIDREGRFLQLEYERFFLINFC